MATKKVPVEPQKRGPKEWTPTPEILETIRLCTSVDMKEKDIAGILGMNDTMFSDYKKKFPEITEVLRTAKSNTHRTLVQMMWEHVKDPTIPYSQKRKDVQYLLTNRFGYNNRVIVQDERAQLPSMLSFEEVTKIDQEND